MKRYGIDRMFFLNPDDKLPHRTGIGNWQPDKRGS
jgi:hypothetical protein